MIDAPLLERARRLGDHFDRHLGMFQPAIFGALAPEAARSVSGEPGEVGLAGDHVGLAGQLRHPEAVDGVVVVQPHQYLAPDRDVDFVHRGDRRAACVGGIIDLPPPLAARYIDAAEVQIGALPGRHLVIRTAAFFSPHDRYNFAWGMIDALRQRRPFRAACDQMVSPTYGPHLVDAVLDLAIDGEVGIWHLSNASATSWSDFAARIADACGMDRSLIEAVPSEELDLRATRPGNTALISCRGQLLPPLDHAVEAFACDAGLMQMMDEPVG